MLLLAQHEREIIVLETSDGPIEVRLSRHGGDEARIGIDAPKSVRIIRRASHDLPGNDDMPATQLQDTPSGADVVSATGTPAVPSIAEASDAGTAEPTVEDSSEPASGASLQTSTAANAGLAADAMPPAGQAPFPSVVAALGLETDDDSWWLHPDDLAEGTEAHVYDTDAALADWDELPD